MSSITLTFGSGEFAWLTLACATGVAIFWLITLQRKISKLEKRIIGHSRSISHMDEWADDVDTRIAILSDAMASNAKEERRPISTTRPFLESFVEKTIAKRDIDTETVSTIVSGLKRPQNTIK